MQEMSILFPGQGAQVASMGRDVADAFTEAMDLWKKAESISGLPLREIYWEGDEQAMNDTRALQPALTVVNLSLWQVIAKKVKAVACAGHSLGEYSALACAGVLDVETTLRLVSLRGALMADCDPDGKGAMAAVVKLPLEKVEEIVAQAKAETGQIILIANYNSPGQYVVSGEKDAVALVASLAKAIKGRALPLAVSGAFHSPCMNEAATQLNKYLQKAVWRKPSCPIYSNVSATALVDGESVKEAMLMQMTSSVRWIDLMQNQYRAGIRTFLEVGPKAVLSKMVSKCVEPIGSDEVNVSVVSNLALCEEFLA